MYIIRGTIPQLIACWIHTQRQLVRRHAGKVFLNPWLVPEDLQGSDKRRGAKGSLAEEFPQPWAGGKRHRKLLGDDWLSSACKRKKDPNLVRMNNISLSYMLNKRCDASDSPQTRVFPRWTRGSRTRAASLSRHSAAEEHTKEVNGVSKTKWVKTLKTFNL